jgi:hypothetical protein
MKYQQSVRSSLVIVLRAYFVFGASFFSSSTIDTSIFPRFLRRLLRCFGTMPTKCEATFRVHVILNMPNSIDIRVYVLGRIALGRIYSFEVYATRSGWNFVKNR